MSARAPAGQGRLGFLDGAITDWLDHGDLERPALRDLLLDTLLGAMSAARAPERA